MSTGINANAYNEFVKYLDKLFYITTGELKAVIKDFHSDMQKGLSGFESSLKMLPSFTDMPKGSEKGKFIALDLGGTNFRVLAVELDGKGRSEVVAVSKYVIKKKDMQGTGEELFDFIAESIKSFMDENKIDFDKKLELAFTFSFPVEQTNIAAGKLLMWTKGFTAKGVEGQDVVVFLNEALKRKGISNVKVAAMANDTVGTLVAKSYTEETCDVGVILGTGSNACYPEKISNIKKWRGIPPKGSMIINMEWGNFDKLPVTCYDKDLDQESVNPGKMRLEKLVSGMYLGEIFRRILCDMIHRDLVYAESIKPVSVKPWTVGTERMSMIEGDTTANLAEVDKLLGEFGITGATIESKQMIVKLCSLVSRRSATIAATAIAAVLKWMDEDIKSKHMVGIDGSLFEKYPGYQKIMEEVLGDLFGATVAKKITLTHAKDGSGVGAAIIAAIAASTEKN